MNQLKSKGKKTWILLSISFLALGLSLLSAADPFWGYWFLLMGISAAFFYPAYQRRIYVRLYKKFINNNLKSIVGEQNTLQIENDFIESSSKIGSSKINLEAIELIFETDKYFLIKLQSAQTFIIPKVQIDAEQFRNELLGISNRSNIKYASDFNWKWK